MKKILSSALMGMMMLFGGFAQASHIDELGIQIALFSNDGLGNFTLRYDMYFGSDTTTTVGPFNDAFDGNWGQTRNSSLTTSGASITGATSFTMAFQGIVDATGAETAGFGSTQTGKFVNDGTDAGKYTSFLNYSIDGYDSNLAYLIGVSSNECCFVSGSGTASFNGQFQFDPSIIVLPPVSGVPEASSIALLGLGLFGLGFTRRKNKSA